MCHATKIIIDKKIWEWTPEEDKIFIDYSMLILAPASWSQYLKLLPDQTYSTVSGRAAIIITLLHKTFIIDLTDQQQQQQQQQQQN